MTDDELDALLGSGSGKHSTDKYITMLRAALCSLRAERDEAQAKLRCHDDAFPECKVAVDGTYAALAEARKDTERLIEVAQILLHHACDPRQYSGEWTDDCQRLAEAIDKAKESKP